MDAKNLRILKEIDVYKKPQLDSEKISVLKPNQIVRFSQEKIRKGVEWIEIYLDNKQKGYILFEHYSYFLCEKFMLEDEDAHGFNYSLLGTTQIPIHELILAPGKLNPETTSVGKIQLKAIHHAEENKISIVDREYDRDLVEVNQLFLAEDDEFYVIDRFSIYTEIESLDGVRGFILQNTRLKTKSDYVVNKVRIFFTIALVVAVYFVIIYSGWIIIGKLSFLIITFAAIFSVLILIFALTKFLTIFNRGFKAIRKRM